MRETVPVCWFIPQMPGRAGGQELSPHLSHVAGKPSATWSITCCPPDNTVTETWSLEWERVWTPGTLRWTQVSAESLTTRPGTQIPVYDTWLAVKANRTLLTSGIWFIPSCYWFRLFLWNLLKSAWINSQLKVWTLLNNQLQFEGKIKFFLPFTDNQ